MKNIIVLSDIQRLKHIYTALKSDANDIDGYIQEAQQCDLKPWLGDAFLLELTEQRASSTLTPENELLLKGGNYTYDNKTYYCEGLHSYMAYCVHARYILRSSVTSTRFGSVVKDSDFSTPATGKQIAEIKSMSEQSAEAIKRDVVNMLNRLYEQYPLYKAGNVYSKSRKQIKVMGE